MDAALPRSILVVESDPLELSECVTLLEGVGYKVASASTFDEAKQKLAGERPDLLLTALRLGPYNGLHLILRSRNEHPGMAAIVTSRFPDATLEVEAQRYQATYLLRSAGREQFLTVVGNVLGVPQSGEPRSAPLAT